MFLQNLFNVNFFLQIVPIGLGLFQLSEMNSELREMNSELREMKFGFREMNFELREMNFGLRELKFGLREINLSCEVLDSQSHRTIRY